MKRLDEASARALLADLPSWQYRPDRGGLIARDYVFADFAAAFGFMAQVALVAERRNHHPEWSNVYHRVSVVLTTHDVDGLSMNDIELAQAMDHAACGHASFPATPPSAPDPGAQPPSKP